MRFLGATFSVALLFNSMQCAKNDDADARPSPPVTSATAPAVVAAAPVRVERIRVPIEGLPTYGDDRAFVTLVAFVDHECPYCAKVQGTIEALRETYGARLRLVIAPRPLPMHEHADAAARAFLAADRLGKGEAMHARLFSGRHPLDEEAIRDAARSVGLDLDVFDAARADKTTDVTLRTSLALASKVGASGTPTFFIDGRRVTGARPFSELKKVIDEELAVAEELLAKGTAPAQLYPTLMKDAKEWVPEPTPVADTAIVPVTIGDAPVRGPARAASTIVIFSDFECPYCVKAEGTLREIEAAHHGNVRIVFKHKPLPMHEHARLAAKASIAAERQGKFWPYHDVLVAHHDALDRASLERYAKEVGLDLVRFTRDIDDPSVEARLAADEAQASSLDVKGTPTLFVDGRRVTGAQPLATFEAMLARTK
jgi:protein-disulfide isomerase